MNTIERIKHGVENRIKEITILMLVAIVISASWLINLLLYPDKPVLQNPALPIISIIICCVIWLYLFKTEWFKNFKKYITIGIMFGLIFMLMIGVLTMYHTKAFWGLEYNTNANTMNTSLNLISNNVLYPIIMPAILIIAGYVLFILVRKGVFKKKWIKRLLT